MRTHILFIICFILVKPAWTQVETLFDQSAEGAITHPNSDSSINYTKDVSTLSRLIGMLHGIHYVCNGKGDQFWRERMVLILNEEVAGQPNLKDSLIQSFNAGFDESRNFYPWCDDKANRARKDIAKRAIVLTKSLAKQNYPEWKWE